MMHRQFHLLVLDVLFHIVQLNGCLVHRIFVHENLGHGMLDEKSYTDMLAWTNFPWTNFRGRNFRGPNFRGRTFRHSPTAQVHLSLFRDITHELLACVLTELTTCLFHGSY